MVTEKDDVHPRFHKILVIFLIHGSKVTISRRLDAPFNPGPNFWWVTSRPVHNLYSEAKIAPRNVETWKVVTFEWVLWRFAILLDRGTNSTSVVVLKIGRDLSIYVNGGCLLLFIKNTLIRSGFNRVP